MARFSLKKKEEGLSDLRRKLTSLKITLSDIEGALHQFFFERPASDASKAQFWSDHEAKLLVEAELIQVSTRIRQIEWYDDMLLREDQRLLVSQEDRDQLNQAAGHAAANGWLRDLKECLRKPGCDINSTSIQTGTPVPSCHLTPLARAVWNGQVGVVEFLLESVVRQEVHIEQRMELGGTAMFWALVAWEEDRNILGRRDVIIELLDAGARTVKLYDAQALSDHQTRVNKGVLFTGVSRGSRPRLLFKGKVVAEVLSQVVNEVGAIKLDFARKLAAAAVLNNIMPTVCTEIVKEYV